MSKNSKKDEKLKEKLNSLFRDISDISDMENSDPPKEKIQKTNETSTKGVTKQIKPIYCSQCHYPINNEPHSFSECYKKKEERAKRIKNHKHQIKKIAPYQNTKIEKNYFIKKLFSYKQQFVVTLEGNIGCGKTTFCEHLKTLLTGDKMNIITFSEPLELWTNLNGENLLEKMYGDPTTWATSFQSFALLTMPKNHLKTHYPGVSILERSIQSSRYCFMELHKDNNRINKTNAQILSQWFDFLENTLQLSIDLTIYIKTQPHVTLKRIKKRNRMGENNITLEYLQKLHEYHENWLINGKFKKPKYIIQINGNNTINEMTIELNEQLKIFLKKNESP